jgi:hypothetical protein
MDGKIYRFFISTIQGMEEVAVDELKDVLPKLDQLHIEKGRRYGRVFFRYTRSPISISQLQAPTNIFGVLAEDTRISVGQPGLARLCECIDQTDLSAAKQLLKACGYTGSNESYQLNLTSKGNYRFSRQHLEKSVRMLLEKGWGLHPGQGNDGLHFHLELKGRRALWAIQLIPSRGRHTIGRGGLGGPLVYCIGRILGGIEPEDIVLSKGLSSNGLAQLNHWQPDGKVINIEGKASQIKREKTVPYYPIQSGLELPVQPGCIDLIIGIWDEEKNKQALLDQWECVIRSGGMLAICTSNASGFLALFAAMASPFALFAQVKLNINGRAYWLLLVERLENKENNDELLQIELAQTEESQDNVLFNR